jgi:hypothetical protein
MELHDIYPVEEIVEYSLYLFLLYFTLFLLAIYIIIKLYKKRKNRPLSALEILECSDHSQAKEMAFKLSYYGKNLVKTAEQEAKFNALKEKLSPFKYSHHDDVLNKTLQDEIEAFLTSLRKP